MCLGRVSFRSRRTHWYFTSSIWVSCELFSWTVGTKTSYKKRFMPTSTVDQDGHLLHLDSYEGPDRNSADTLATLPQVLRRYSGVVFVTLN